MILEFVVNKQKIERTDFNEVVSDSENYLKAHFTFSEDWNGLEKTAIFTKGSLTILVENIDDEIIEVPVQVIAPYGFKVSVIGRENGIQKNITTIPAKVKVFDSEYSGGLIPVKVGVEAKVEGDTLILSDAEVVDGVLVL